MALQTIVLTFCLVLAPAAASGQEFACSHAADARIADAVRRIQESVDPCGESVEVTALLERLASCARNRYEICTSTTTDRNLFTDRTITWNPDLRSELEPGRGGPPVNRDPTASLLHELVHALHHCEGLKPGEHELEAVRIENIYRRAAGLGQRTQYGDEPLPPAMVRVCVADRCACSVPESHTVPSSPVHVLPIGRQAADSVSTRGNLDTESAR